MKDASLKSQMKQANKVKARYVLIVGENELEQGQAVLRNMETQEQQEISISTGIDGLSQFLACECKPLGTFADSLVEKA